MHNHVIESLINNNFQHFQSLIRFESCLVRGHKCSITYGQTNINCRQIITYSLNAVYNWNLTVFLVSIILSGLFTNKTPDFVKVDGWTVIFVVCLVEMSHTNFTEVSRMVFVHKSSVVMLTTSLSSTSGMFSVFA